MRFTVARGVSGVLLLAFVAALTVRSSATSAQGGRATGIPVDADDIAGTVTSTRGPEAGVWVIAETADTPTKFRKIVVTDEQGRYLLPDLPTKATYSIWVRGYGLIDSAPVRGTAGRNLSVARPGLRAFAEADWRCGHSDAEPKEWEAGLGDRVHAAPRRELRGADGRREQAAGQRQLYAGT